MKVIDLLNKIANKEEIPLIKYNGRILHYDYLNEWFEDKRDNGFCKMEVYYEDLNDNVDIVEDDYIEVCGSYFTKEEYERLKDNKKIEKIEYTNHDGKYYMRVNDKQNYIIREVDTILIDEINKILDKINEVE